MAQLGFHRLTACFVAWQIVLLGVTVAAFRAAGLGIARDGVLNYTSFSIPFIMFVWMMQVWLPDRKPGQWVVTEVVLVFALLSSFTVIGSPLQYAAIAAIKMPLADGWLAATDALLGIHVPSLVAWTKTHPTLVWVLTKAYFTLLPQFALPLAVLGCWYKDRHGLWEFAWHFQVCLMVTLLGLALFPAACAFTYYGFESIFEQKRFTAQFNAARAGTMAVVPLGGIEGMITFPSFHAAGGMMVTWAFRRYRVWCAALVVLNGFLIAATVLTGAHYAIDVIASVIVFALSVVLWRTVGIHLLPFSKADGHHLHGVGGVELANQGRRP